MRTYLRPITINHIARIGTLVALITLISLLILQERHVTAQGTSSKLWSTDAMACVPNGSTTQDNLVQTSHGHARYTEGKTGDLYLICPFTDARLHGMNVRFIQVTFQYAGSARVAADLRQIDKRTGNIVNLLSINNVQPCLTTSTSLGAQYSECTGAGNGPKLDFNNYYYYVQLSLQRTNAADNVRIMGASIW